MGRTIGTFEDNRSRTCKDFEYAILIIVFEIYDVTNTESGGASVTDRHSWGIGAKIRKGRRNGLTFRKLLSLQKRSSLRTTELKIIKQSGKRQTGEGAHTKRVFLH